MNHTGRLLAAAVSLATVASLAVTACSAPAGPAPAHRTEEQAAVLNWLAKTNAMWTHNDFAALDEITTAEMRTIYLAERQGASLPSNASRQPFQLTGLSITIPCQAGRPGVFVAYGDTDVFDLGPAMQPMAMVFQRSDGRWKLAAAVNRPARGWPALCTEGAPPSAPPALAAADYAPELARVLTHATTGSAETTATAAPFAVNDFFAGSGSISAQAARQAGQLHSGLHHDREPDARAAAGGRARLLDDRHPDRDRPLRLDGRAAREELAGRQPGGHPQARRRAPRDRHLHHHVHRDRPAAFGRRHAHPGRLLRLAPVGGGELARP
jgi:hypothetical protein